MAFPVRRTKKYSITKLKENKHLHTRLRVKLNSLLSLTKYLREIY